jgi:hypothetical protein
MVATLGFAEAFGKYGAKLKNVNWSVCAESPDGALVVSFWSHHFKKAPDGALICADTAARWFGPGKNEFCERFAKAYADNQPIRVVIATTTEPERVDAGEDASKLPKTFTVRQDLIGRIVKFDGENFEVKFQRNGT